MKEVLNAVETKEDYDKYSHLVKKHLKDHDLERILLGVGDYYVETTSTELDWHVFSTWFILKNPMMKEDKRKLFQSIFESLELTSGTAVSKDLVDILLKQYHAERIAFLSMQVAEGKTGVSLEDVQLEVADYMAKSGQVLDASTEMVANNLSVLLSELTHGDGLSWRLPCFNEALGPLRLGNFIMFAGRVESGKSTLLYSEASHMAEQLAADKKCIFFTNEEAGKAVMTRLYSSLLGVDLAELNKDPAFYMNEWDRRMGGDRDKIIVVEKHDLSTRDIEHWLNKEDVGLICIDQLRKVQSFTDLKGIQKLEKLFQWARELSKTYAPVMTVGQLDASAENVQYPSLSSLYESKTSAQGELDVLVTIGQIDGSVPENARWLSVRKNKMPTPLYPNLRHGNFEVSINAPLARFV